MDIKTEENLLHLGADLPTELVKTFRETAKRERYKKKDVLRRFAEWWTMLDKDARKEFYHGGEPVPSRPVLRQVVSEVIDEYESRQQASKHLPRAKSAGSR